MLCAKEQRATEIIIYELRKWDDESHRRLSVTGINIIAATYKSLDMTASPKGVTPKAKTSQHQPSL